MKAKKKKFKLWLSAMAGLVVIIPVLWILLVKLEGKGPDVRLDPSPSAIGVSTRLSVTVSDEKSGVRKVWIGLLKDRQEKVLFEKAFPSTGFLGRGKVKKETLTVSVEPKRLRISDGEAILRLRVEDFSWRRWWHGNQTYIEKTVRIDTRPPKVDVLSHTQYISQGGAGVVIFRISEPCVRKGVVVGENFFPAHPGFFKNNKTLIAFIALDHRQGPGTQIFIQATDAAGNRTKAGFSHRIKKRRFKKDKIHVSDRFLNWKMPEFERDIPNDPNETMLERFLKVNRDLRATNFKKIVAIGKSTETVLYWKGAFLRLPNSKRMAGFADFREYRYKGKSIDQEFHLGVDLASLSHSPVPAANRGKVVFANHLGIYGKTIIIDHGFGLFSMYSHLSRLNVQTGQIVAKKEIIGHTGLTGLAGGDHLHFSMLIHNTFVYPVEWWDASWIENNILMKIRDAETGYS